MTRKRIPTQSAESGCTTSAYTKGGTVGPRDRLRRVLLHVFRPDVVEEVPPLLADLDLLQVVVVEPDLEPVEVALGVRLPALSMLDRKVGVDAIGRVPRLIHDHGRDCHDRQSDSSGKA